MIFIIKSLIMQNLKLKRVARIGLHTVDQDSLDAGRDGRRGLNRSSRYAILVKEEYLERMNKTHAELHEKVNYVSS